MIITICMVKGIRAADDRELADFVGLDTLWSFSFNAPVVTGS
jgi:hypothetical protein